MNAKQAKEIKIIELLAALDILPVYKYPKYYWYKSPIRNENSPSLRVDLNLNLWYDTGEARGGDILKFAMEYYNCNLSGALANIAQSMSGFSPSQQQNLYSKPTAETARLHKVKPLKNPALITYLTSRMIPTRYAMPYLKDVYYYIGSKHYFSLGFANDAGGYELRNAYFKGCLGSKSISFLKGSLPSGTVNIFEGFFDFLSACVVAKKSQPHNDTFVLNSTSLRENVLCRLGNYKAVNLFLDNDTSGNETTNYFIGNHANAIDQRKFYAGYEDLNEYLIKTKSNKGIMQA